MNIISLNLNIYFVGIVKQQNDESHFLGCKCILVLDRMGAS